MPIRIVIRHKTATMVKWVSRVSHEPTMAEARDFVGTMIDACSTTEFIVLFFDQAAFKLHIAEDPTSPIFPLEEWRTPDRRP